MGKFPFHIDCGTSSVESDTCWFPFYGGPNLEKIPKKPTTPPKKKKTSSTTKIAPTTRVFRIFDLCNRRKSAGNCFWHWTSGRSEPEEPNPAGLKTQKSWAFWYFGITDELVAEVCTCDWSFFSQLNVWRTHRTFMGASDDGTFPGSGDLTLSYFI